VLTIFRVWHNFVWVSPRTKKAAAMQLGLAHGKIRIQDILYFDVRDSLKQEEYIYGN
jgi:hypothetical protein